MNLSAHFTLDELCATTHRDWIGPNREAAGEFLSALTDLCGLLERVRALCGSRPLVIHSGFRCPGLNAAIGGSKTSQHLLGQAADFHVAGLDLTETWRLIAESGLPFGQLILEGWGAGRPTWIHLSTVGKRSRQRCGEVMTWDADRGYHVVRRVPVA